MYIYKKEKPKMLIAKKNITCFIILSVLLLLTIVSCERKSGRIQPTIKVVIMDSTPYSGGVYNYKIKVLTNNTVGYTASMYKYEVGDTILSKTSLIKY